MVRLTRWGNSTGLRLAATVMEAAGLKVGDFVQVRLLDSGDIRVRPSRGAQIVTMDTPNEAIRPVPIEEEQW